MFPAPSQVVERIEFSEVRKDDPAYADLLQKEYEFCRAHEDELMKKAEKTYRIGCNPGHFLNKFCCNFMLLEQKSDDYFVTILDEAFEEFAKRHTEDAEEMQPTIESEETLAT